MNTLFAILILALFVLLFGVTLLWLISLAGPKIKPDAVKLMPYESGVPGENPTDSKISVKYYLTAILFIVFDIEIVFMYPWAVNYIDQVRQGHGLYALSVMGVFVFLFIIGLIWEIKSRALDWD